MSFIYSLQADGKLLWYRHLGNPDGSDLWSGPQQVGQGWQSFKGIFSSADVLYAIQFDGILLWYRHVGQVNGTNLWSGPTQVGQGWHNFKGIFAASDGVIYTIENDGKLLWYKHNGWTDGSNTWMGPQEVGIGWQEFKHVFAGSNGVIYAVQGNGSLLWFRHVGQANGSDAWEGPNQVGSGWQDFKDLFLREGNLLYAVQRNGSLLWFRHVGQANGSDAWDGPNQVGSGWHSFRHVLGGATEPIGMNFTFDAAITSQQTITLLERHRFAFSQIMGCNSLNVAERQSLLSAYFRPIVHGIETRPNVNASAIVGGSQLWVNFGVLFPQGAVEIAQTLIHEMMHCAGLSHPNRRNPPVGMSCAAPDPAIFDCPFDNGQYYGTPPLRAELCIAGNQSDLALVGEKSIQDSCVIDDQGVATIYRD